MFRQITTATLSLSLLFRYASVRILILISLRLVSQPWFRHLNVFKVLMFVVFRFFLIYLHLSAFTYE